MDHIQPFLLHHEKEVDVSISKFKNLFHNQVDSTKSRFASSLRASVLEWISYGWNISQTQQQNEDHSITKILPPLLKSKKSFSRKRFSKVSEKKSNDSLGSISPLKSISSTKKKVNTSDSFHGNKNELEEIEDLTLQDYYESDFDQ